jgi:hypothetical protein
MSTINPGPASHALRAVSLLRHAASDTTSSTDSRTVTPKARDSDRPARNAPAWHVASSWLASALAGSRWSEKLATIDRF